MAKILKFKKDAYERKPNPGVIISAVNEYNLDINKCYIIGDMASDIGCGINAGIKTILVKTGLGETAIKNNFIYKKEIQYKPDYIADDIYSAVNEIILS